MPAVDMGASVALTWTSIASGAAVVTLTAPDGTTTTPAVTNTGAAHTATLAVSQAGRWLISWHLGSTEAYTDVIDAWPADPRFLISLADCRAALGLTAVNAATDDDLRLYIAAATPIIEDICGPILTDIRVQVGDASRSTIVLYDRPTTLTSVTVDGVLQAVTTNYTADLVGGVITSVGVSFGGAVVTVAYTVGAKVVPPNIRIAAREQVRFSWQIGKQGARPNPQQVDSSMAWTPSGFAVPRRVIEWCGPQRRPGGFA